MKDPKTMTRAEALKTIERIREGHDPELAEFARRAMTPWPGNPEAAAQWAALFDVAHAPLNDSEKAAQAAAEAKQHQSGPTPEQIADARLEIGALSADENFWTKFKDPNALGHRHVRNLWERLHKIAYTDEQPQQVIALAATGSPLK